jgi:hypothetical protein
MLIRRRGIWLTTVRLITCLALTFGPVATAQERQAEESYNEFSRLCLVSFLSTPHVTHSDFTVKVAFNGTAMADVAVVLEANESIPTFVSAEPISRRTDSSGIAEFSAIQPGEYWIRVDELLFESLATVTVDPDATDTEDVELEWPSVSETVQNVRGTLISSESSAPVAGVRVELLDIRTARVLGVTWTDLAGFYEIPFTDEGIYALRFSPPDEFGGHEDLGIELSNKKGSDQLSTMKLESDSCGVQLFPIKPNLPR